jgi:hypothetical protein
MFAQLAVICGIVSLAACVMAGAAAVPRGEPAAACALRIDRGADGFALAGEVGGAGAGEWTLRAEAHDGSVNIVQSGPVLPGAGAGVAVLPGDPAGYDLSMTVSRAGGLQTCPVIR